MKTIAIIPARYASTRFPGKPLAILGGKPVIQRVYEQAREVLDEAVAALSMLGFSPAPAHKAVQKILQDEPDAPVERVIKLALKML